MLSINSIIIQSSYDECVEYMLGDSGWVRQEKVNELVDGAEKLNTYISRCSVEDVIVALLLNMGQQDVCIFVRRDQGTAVPAQSWRMLVGGEISGPYNYFNSNSDLEIK